MSISRRNLIKLGALAGAFSLVSNDLLAESTTMAGMLSEIGTATTSSAQSTWLPTAFLEKRNVSAWSDMPVWVPDLAACRT